MKQLLLFLLGILVVILFVSSYRQKAAQLLSYSQCDTPLSYQIGSIDQRFGLSRDQVLNDITMATDIWSKAEGKKLFVYSQTANLTVNFVYDQRQSLDTAINQLNTKLNQNSTTLQQQVNKYQAQVTSFKERLVAFKNTVNQYNNEGGAPPSAYSDLIAQQNQFKAEGDSLNAQARQLNLSTNDYNASVSVLNQDINQFNIALAKKPEEGIYNGGNDAITIYFVNNHRELLHTLAHEFGHSMGMIHVGDPAAIMYPYTTDSLMVTSDEMQQLDYICREQSSFTHWIDEFDLWFVTQMQIFKQYFSNGKK